MDLTPFFTAFTKTPHFHHQVRKDALAPFGDDKYLRFKQGAMSILPQAPAGGAAWHRRRVFFDGLVMNAEL
jgi:hypothetical protein